MLDVQAFLLSCSIRYEGWFRFEGRIRVTFDVVVVIPIVNSIIKDVR